MEFVLLDIAGAHRERDNCNLKNKQKLHIKSIFK
jgi:hypothetical protein